MASRPKKPNKNKKQRRPSGARGAVSQRVATRGYYWAASAIGAALVLAVVIKVRMNATDSAPTVGQLSETDAIGQAIEPIDAIVADEELLLELTPELKDLTRSVLNLQLPDLASVDIFADDVTVKDLGHTPPRVVKRFDSVSTRTRSWPVTEPERSLSESRLDLWNPLWKHVAYFEHAKFYFIRGTLSGVDDFDTQVGFAGLARTRAGGFSAVKAQQQVRWRRLVQQGLDGEPRWRIAQWHLTEFQTLDAPQLLFDEVLDRVLPRTDDRNRARESIQEYLTIALRRAGMTTGTSGLARLEVPADVGKYFTTPFTRYFTNDSLGNHPGLAVVDVDDDGLDDLFLAAQWGNSQLLHNRGDGTFTEIAAQLGLDIDGFSTSAVFADFDNDGDADLIVGRYLAPSQYLINEGGRFVDCTASHVSAKMPLLVTSVSAVDYNGDGLLDVYFSTYSASQIRERVGATSHGTERWPRDFLPPHQAQEVLRRQRTAHRFLDNIGPPNVLLVNLGQGRFALAPENEQLAVWRSTFQAAWSDYDDDGDPDLYVANDFALDRLFRNDGPSGFADVTQQTGLERMGFGMGASWGDYDNDGRQDLYISNMFSKAGRRIMDRISSLDPRFAHLAEGNYLYRNRGGSFDKVSGHEPSSLQVALAGWSWGGQFADLDNDGYLDIYVNSGFYTPPSQFASEMDL